MQPGGTYSILCPVNALRTDRVLVTSSELAGTIISAFPLGDPFGHVVLHVRNDLSSPINFGSNNPGISIVVYCCETQVFAR
jgi:hypothetical protein